MFSIENIIESKNMFVFFFVNSNIDENWIIDFGNFSGQIPLGFSKRKHQ